MEFTFKKVVDQVELSKNVTVIDEQSVQAASGVITVTIDTCECSTYAYLKLPCRHIFAMRSYQDLDLFCPDVVATRWTRAYNNNHVPQYTTQSPMKTSLLVTPRKKVLGLSEKYKKTTRTT
jgi:hypothetical protein